MVLYHVLDFHLSRDARGSGRWAYTLVLVCPRCGNTMDIEKAEDVEVDVCLTCNGVWLDAGELEKLQEKSEAGYHGDEAAKLEELEEERDWYLDGIKKYKKWVEKRKRKRFQRRKSKNTYQNKKEKNMLVDDH